MFDMKGKMSSLKKKMEEADKLLIKTEIKAESTDGMVTVIANGKRNIISITINHKLMNNEIKSDLELTLVQAVNEVLVKADEVAQAELKNATEGLLPDIPGLG